MNIKDLETKYKCDKCGFVFKGKDVLLKPMIEGFGGSSPMMTFKYVNKEGKIMGGNQSPSLEDRTMHCPKCKTVHLFGFDEV